jgi:Mg2+/citrate symporter
VTVTRDDLEAKLSEIEAALGKQAEKARSKMLPIGIIGVIVLLVVVFLLGRRRGRKSRTIVEIRRF